MPYSEADFERMENDPALRRAYCCQCGQRALLRARSLRRKGDHCKARTEELVLRRRCPSRSGRCAPRLRSEHWKVRVRVALVNGTALRFHCGERSESRLE